MIKEAKFTSRLSEAHAELKKASTQEKVLKRQIQEELRILPALGIAHFYPSVRGCVIVESLQHMSLYTLWENDGLGIPVAVTAEVIHDQTFVELR